MIGGVAAGLADHLGLPVRQVRIGLGVSSIFGAGLVLYAWLWALVPETAPDRSEPGLRSAEVPSTPEAAAEAEGSAGGSSPGWSCRC